MRYDISTLSLKEARSPALLINNVTIAKNGNLNDIEISYNIFDYLDAYQNFVWVTNDSIFNNLSCKILLCEDKTIFEQINKINYKNYINDRALSLDTIKVFTQSVNQELSSVRDSYKNFTSNSRPKEAVKLRKIEFFRGPIKSVEDEYVFSYLMTKKITKYEIKNFLGIFIIPELDPIEYLLDAGKNAPNPFIEYFPIKFTLLENSFVFTDISLNVRYDLDTDVVGFPENPTAEELENLKKVIFQDFPPDFYEKKNYPLIVKQIELLENSNILEGAGEAQKNLQPISLPPDQTSTGQVQATPVGTSQQNLTLTITPQAPTSEFDNKKFVKVKTSDNKDLVQRISKNLNLEKNSYFSDFYPSYKFPERVLDIFYFFDYKSFIKNNSPVLATFLPEYVNSLSEEVFKLFNNNINIYFTPDYLSKIPSDEINSFRKEFIPALIEQLDSAPNLLFSNFTDPNIFNMFEKSIDVSYTVNVEFEDPIKKDLDNLLANCQIDLLNLKAFITFISNNPSSYDFDNNKLVPNQKHEQILASFDPLVDNFVDLKKRYEKINNISTYPDSLKKLLNFNVVTKNIMENFLNVYESLFISVVNKTKLFSLKQFFSENTGVIFSSANKYFIGKQIGWNAKNPLTELQASSIFNYEGQEVLSLIQKNVDLFQLKGLLETLNNKITNINFSNELLEFDNNNNISRSIPLTSTQVKDIFTLITLKIYLGKDLKNIQILINGLKQNQTFDTVIQNIILDDTILNNLYKKIFSSEGGNLTREQKINQISTKFSTPADDTNPFFVFSRDLNLLRQNAFLDDYFLLFYYLCYCNTLKVEYLSGFKEKNGQIMLKSPIWKTSSSETPTNLTNFYKLSKLDISEVFLGARESYDLPIVKQYFIF